MTDQTTTQPGEGQSPSESPKVSPVEIQAPAPKAAMPQGGQPPMNPYLAGFFLGLTLLASFLILGTGLGASGGFARLAAWAEHLIAPAHVEAGEYFKQWLPSPLRYYMVFMVLGAFLGGTLSALTAGRFAFKTERGLTTSRTRRVLLALVGGALSGFAARLAQGCTSGQGLSGGALLLTGSMVFMACLFATGYLTAWIFGRQWK